MARNKTSEKGIWLGLIAYIVLSVVKFFIGLATRSEALKADGLNNATDIVLTITVLVALKISQKPADSDHPYGHSRAEMIGALIASFIMITVGIQVIIQSIRILYVGDYHTPELLAAWVSLVAALIMYIVYRYNRKLAKLNNSHAVMAAAKDNLSDAYVSIGAFVGIVLAQIGLPWLDPLVSLGIGFIICKTAWGIFYDATHTLTDGYDPKRLEIYCQTIETIRGVDEVSQIKARSDGSTTYLDIIITVDPNLSVYASHAISDAVEEALEQKHKITNVVVHIEPANYDRSPSSP